MIFAQAVNLHAKRSNLYLTKLLDRVWIWHDNEYSEYGVVSLLQRGEDEEAVAIVLSFDELLEITKLAAAERGLKITTTPT